MAYDVKNGLLLLGVLAALFWWSVWAGLAGIAAIIVWIARMMSVEAIQKRRMRKRCREQIARALGEDAAEIVFHSFLGVAAIGVTANGSRFAYASAEEAEVYDSNAIFEARARKLPQGDFEIGISVPGRVTGKPNWRVLLVRSRDEATRWTETLGPVLGTRLKSDL